MTTGVRQVLTQIHDLYDLSKGPISYTTDQICYSVPCGSKQIDFYNSVKNQVTSGEWPFLPRAIICPLEIAAHKLSLVFLGVIVSYKKKYFLSKSM